MVRMPGHESSDLVTQKKTAHLSDIAASVRANLAEDASPARDHRSSRSRTRARGDIAQASLSVRNGTRQYSANSRLRFGAWRRIGSEVKAWPK